MIEIEHIRQEFDRILNQRPDIGTARILSNRFLEPPNPFDPNARRRPRASLVIAWSYLVLMAAAWCAFNFR